MSRLVRANPPVVRRSRLISPARVARLSSQSKLRLTARILLRANGDGPGERFVWEVAFINRRRLALKKRGERGSARSARAKSRRLRVAVNFRRVINSRRTKFLGARESASETRRVNLSLHCPTRVIVSVGQEGAFHTFCRSLVLVPTTSAYGAPKMITRDNFAVKSRIDGRVRERDRRASRKFA